jgi:flagellar export protein FliJ
VSSAVGVPGLSGIGGGGPRSGPRARVREADIEHLSSALRVRGLVSMTRAVSTRPFTFRLERVRSLRERAEDRAKEEYAASLAHRVEGAAMLRAAAEHRDRARAEARPAADAALSGMDLLASQAWLDRLERARQAAELELDRRDAEVDARHTALVQAARERHALERLAEKRRAEHALETNRREAYELDELAAAGHRRRSS